MLSGGGGRTGVRPRACLAQSALHVQAPSTRHCMLTAVSVAAGKAQITSGRRLPSFRRKQRSSMAACLLQLRRMPSGPAPACGKHAGRRLRCAVQALRGGSATTGGLSRRQHTQERILRYPDGRERVLRYSCEATMEEDDEEASFAAWEGSGFYVVPGRRDQAGQQVGRGGHCSGQQRQQHGAAAAAAAAAPGACGRAYAAAHLLLHRRLPQRSSMAAQQCRALRTQRRTWRACLLLRMRCSQRWTWTIPTRWGCAGAATCC